MNININLKQQLNKIPSSPGAYLFKDAKGKNVYIGKAVNLRARVKSYFVKNALYGIKASMLPEIAKIDYKATDTEIDALILESQLIKKYRPKYNVILKDDKNYFYVAFTNDKFSKIFITHQPQKVKSLKLKVESLGPYTDGMALKATLKYLRKIFPYCTCKTQHKLPCLKSHLGLCLCVCCLKQQNNSRIANNQAKEYKKNIKMITDILSGRRKNILRKMEKEMKQAVKSQDFENAAKIRDRLAGIQNIFAHRIFERGKNNVPSSAVKSLSDLFSLKTIRRIEFYDISNIQGQLATGSMVVFDDSKIDKNQYRKFKIKTVLQSDDPAMMKEVLIRRLKHADWPKPDLIIVDGGITQFNATREALRNASLRIKCASLAKNPDRLFVSPIKVVALKDMPQSLNLFLQNLRDEAHRFAITYHRKLRSRKLKNGFADFVCERSE